MFFCNSGAEACEAAIKAARRYHFVSGKPERWRIVTFNGSFHGRTLATIAAGGNAKYLEGFGPPVEGFDHVPFGDLAAVEQAIGPETAAIMIEPAQGEGGINVASTEFLQALRALCDKHGLLLIFDEVQCGMGRTGKLFAYEWAGITPDLMPIAKGIGGGFPLGALLATEEAAKGLTPGTHGSTFGGNPLATAVGYAVLDSVLEPGFLDGRAAEGAAPEAGACRRQGRTSRSRRRGARPGPAHRHQGDGGASRGRQGGARRKPARRRVPATTSSGSCRRSISPTRRSPRRRNACRARSIAWRRPQVEIHFPLSRPECHGHKIT